MHPLAIEDLDFSPFQSVPMLNSEAIYMLSMDLDALKPDDAPRSVLDAAADMVTTAQAIHAELFRRVEDGEHPPIRDADFDLFVDRLWASTRAQIDYWKTFAEAAADELSPEQRARIDLDGCRAKAELADELSAHLFGEISLQFTQRPLAEQLALMASRLEFVRTSAKASAYTELIGPERLAALELAVARFRAMVRERAGRTEPSSLLRPLRRRLQRQISQYAASVLALIRDDDPGSARKVLAALQPMVAVRRERPPSEDADYPTGYGRAPIAPPPAYAGELEARADG